MLFRNLHIDLPNGLFRSGFPPAIVHIYSQVFARKFVKCKAHRSIWQAASVLRWKIFSLSPNPNTGGSFLVVTRGSWTVKNDRQGE
jgi:hypothetical protein